VKKGIILLTLIMLMGGDPLFAGESGDRNLAEGFITRFLDCLGSGEWDRCEKYLTAASEFGRDLSDYWYCAALLSEHKGLVRQSLDEIEEAVRIDNWKLAALGDGAALQYRLMFRLGQYKEQIALYEKGYPVHSQSRDILDITIRSCLWGGFRKKAGDLLKKAFSLYPGEQRFFMYRLLLTGDVKDWDVWSNQVRRGNLDMVPCLRDYMVYAGEKPQAAALEYWETLPAGLRDPGRDLFRISGAGLTLESLPDGEYFWDGNRDGFTNETIVLKEGSPSDWFVDRDQDGEPELHILFDAGGIPLSLRMGNLFIEYVSYPFAGRVVITEKALDWESDLIFEYGDLPLPVADRDSGSYLPELVTVRVDEKSLFGKAVRIQEKVGGITVRTYTVSEGDILSISEDTDMNGVNDRELRLEYGVITFGLRDLDEDGVTDIHEYYSDGKWEGLAWDSDGDNQPEYYHDWSMLPVHIWDTDGDGRMDIFFMTGRNDETIRSEILFPQWLGKTDFLAWDFTYERHWFR
jgi:tetratricopeptide (TPR) repeat protein